MAYDAGLAQLWQEDLADLPGISERRMFGGLCFMQFGHMLCGVMKDGGMARVGKAHMAQACAVEGAAPLAFTGRAMGGLVELNTDLMADDARRGVILALALDFVASLPPK